MTGQTTQLWGHSRHIVKLYMKLECEIEIEYMVGQNSSKYNHKNKQKYDMQMVILSTQNWLA